MSDKKHIDRLYQEKFKDFEVNPSDAVWGKIEAKLKEKKKKRRFIPIWWRYAGVAALLLLFLAIASLYFNNQEELPINNVVDTDSSTEIEEKKNQNNLFQSNSDEETISIVQSDEDSNQINSSNNNGTLNNSSLKKEAENINVSSKNSVAKTNSYISNNENVLSEKNRTDKSNVPTLNKSDINQSPIQNQNTAIVDLQNNDLQKVPKAVNSFDKVKIEDKIKTLSKTDSLTIAKTDIKTKLLIEKENNKQGNTIEEALEKTKEIIEEEKFNRWSVAPNAAPVYFNSLGEGSSLDSQFNSNAKSSDLNMSYGVKASYAVNKRLSIRSGINRVSLGYNTNNVVAFQSIASQSSSISQLPNLKTNYSLDAVNNTSFISGENIASKSSRNLLSTATNTSINQEFGYIEIPLEIQYNLLNKTFGINVIGGFSSLFLNENKIYSESGGNRIFVGEANNINNVSYSANFGLGFNYKLSKKLDLNLEPMFKYQINTFENTSGDFKPYFIGVYTGFAIKF